MACDSSVDSAEIVSAMAALIGMSVQEKAEPDVESSLESMGIAIPNPRVEQPIPSGYPKNLENIAFWLQTYYERMLSASETLPEKEKQEARLAWTNPPKKRPLHQPLMPWKSLRSLLKDTTHPISTSHSVDIGKLTRHIAQGEFIQSIPKRSQRRSTQRLNLVIDRSSRLIPFAQDQDLVWRQLQQASPHGRLRFFECHSPFQMVTATSDGNTEDASYIERQLLDGSVLILGDLGVLEKNQPLEKQWLAWVRRLHQRGVRISALVPYSLDRVPNAFKSCLQAIPWQGSTVASVRDAEARNKLVEDLLTLAGPTFRLEPSLLRDLRLLSPNACDASIESDVWQSAHLASNHPEAAKNDLPASKQLFMEKFERLTPEVRQRALKTIRKWRVCLPSAQLWFSELLNLEESSRKLIEKSDTEDARNSIRWIKESLESGLGGLARREFFDRVTGRSTDPALTDPEVGEIYRNYRYLFHRHMGLHPATKPTDIDECQDEKMVSIEVSDRVVRLGASPARSLVAVPIRTTNGIIKIASESDESRFWKGGKKPDYVSDFGRDEYGAWFEFQLPHHDGQGVVTQRMRWIRPGTFMMGSPVDEPERWVGENLHQVTLTHGFWLADTACTQAMWQAVMGWNPSIFKGELRPVVQVSHGNVIAFCKDLSQRMPGLMPQLPSDAQWEYACRAGTQTPFHFGESISTDQANFNGNNPYVNGPKGIFRQETVGVKDLPANAWGLYQMHGNVWEWCADWHIGELTGPQVDPTGPKQRDNRVVRGGGWNSNALYVRSAHRADCWPGLRDGDLGFRLLSSASAEPNEMVELPVAEQGSEPSRFGAAVVFSHVFSLHDFDAAPIEFPLAELVPESLQPTLKSELEPARSTRTSTLLLSSNLEKIRYERVEKPEWAVTYGQDPYGTYADIRVDGLGVDDIPVRQRLRWIPPGRFQMGSPDGEPGRHDNEILHDILHDVTVSNGYWMFDTPCTQRLWQAVMPSNPSYFKDPDRPVESVSWDDANEFAALWNRQLTRFAIEFRLPTEAEWEYACRAGTASAIYTGDLEILGNANAPALDGIAWYGGNCGYEYDLDLSKSLEHPWLSDQQYPAKLGGTRKVKGKAPNALGLYDMLGNVWEWCHDGMRNYSNAPQVDATGELGGTDRVVRGGCWASDAADVRCAYRGVVVPGDQYDHLGFRLLSSARKTKQLQAVNGVSGSKGSPRDEAERRTSDRSETHRVSPPAPRFGERGSGG
jgi:formylglycine-generating enzyme required for sulfatase activity